MTAFSLETAARSWHKTEIAELVCLVGIFMLSGLGLGGCRDLLGRARADGKLTMLDTGWDPANWPELNLVGIRSLLSEVVSLSPQYGRGAGDHAERNARRSCPGAAENGSTARGDQVRRRGELCNRRRANLLVPALSVSVFDALELVTISMLVSSGPAAGCNFSLPGMATRLPHCIFHAGQSDFPGWRRC